MTFGEFADARRSEVRNARYASAIGERLSRNGMSSTFGGGAPSFSSSSTTRSRAVQR